jgi:hypothetical protein
MKHYKNLSELIKDKSDYPLSGRVFIQKSKMNDIANAEYWVISSKESLEQDFEEDENGARIPVSLVEFNVRRLLDVQILKNIIENKLEHNPDLTLDQTPIFAEAINYYLENDDFLD